MTELTVTTYFPRFMANFYQEFFSRCGILLRLVKQFLAAT
jgi:hypothetical protein